MKSKCIFCFLIVLFQFSNSQSWLWGVKGIGDAYLQSIATDSKGNCLAAGILRQDTVHFGSYILIDTGYNYDFYLLKLDKSGTVLWVKQTYNIPISNGNADLGDVGVSTDGTGNSFLTADFFDTLIIGSNILVSDKGVRNIFLAKFDAGGNVIWCRKSLCLKDSASVNSTDISTDRFGNTFVAGGFNDSVQLGSQKLFVRTTNNGFTYLVKYDSNGNFKWARQSTGGGHNGATLWGVATDRFGNSFVTGCFIDTVTFGPFTLSTPVIHGGGPVFLVKYDSSGNVVWAKQSKNSFSNFSSSSGWRAVTDFVGNIYLEGAFTDTIVFDNDTLIASKINHSQYTTFIVKFDPNGNVIWAKQVEDLGDNGWAPCAISIDKYNHIYFSAGGGEYNCKLEFDSTILQLTDTAKWGNALIIFELDSNGNVLCSTIMPGGGGTGFGGLASDSSGDYVYCGGYTTTPLVFGNDTVEPFSMPFDSNWLPNNMPFVARWGECDVTLGVNEVKGESENVKVYPNPTSSIAEIVVSGQWSVVSEMQVEVFNVFGQKVFSVPFQLPPASSACQINLSSQPEGVYFYRVIKEEVASPNLAMMVVGSGKIIIEK